MNTIATHTAPISGLLSLVADALEPTSNGSGVRRPGTPAAGASRPLRCARPLVRGWIAVHEDGPRLGAGAVRTNAAATSGRVETAGDRAEPPALRLRSASAAGRTRPDRPRAGGALPGRHGATNRAIAARLFISPKTASVHVSRILTKLEADTRTEAAAWRTPLGLVQPWGAMSAVEAGPPSGLSPWGARRAPAHGRPGSRVPDRHDHHAVRAPGGSGHRAERRPDPTGSARSGTGSRPRPGPSSAHRAQVTPAQARSGDRRLLRGHELRVVEPRVRAVARRAARRGCPARRCAPSSITRIRSASRIVDSRWAITKRRAVRAQRRHRVLQQQLGAGVDRRRRLVEDQQRRVGQERPRDRDQLPLAGAKVACPPRR